MIIIIISLPKIIISQVMSFMAKIITDIINKFLKINSGAGPLFRPKLKVNFTSELF